MLARRTPHPRPGVDDVRDAGAPIDAGRNAPADAGGILRVDAGVRARDDAGADAGVDEGADEGVDEGADEGVDEGTDEGVDEGLDAGVGEDDEGVDAAVDANVDQVIDAGIDGGISAGDVVVDAGSPSAPDGGPPQASPAPTITLHPQPATVLEGTPHMFTAAADDWHDVIWQYLDGSTWVSIAGSSGSTSYTTHPAVRSWHDGRRYRARFTNVDASAAVDTDAATLTVALPPPPAVVEPDRAHATFEAAPLTGFDQPSAMRAIFVDELGTRRSSYRESELSIASDGENKYLRQRYVPSSSGTPVVGYQASFAGADEMWLSYRVYFEPGFQWVKGGKLPGLFGGSLPSGGSTSRDGFSARMMWRASQRLAFYAYHYVEDRPGYEPGKSTVYGEDFPFTDPADPSGIFRIPLGRWITVMHHIKLNTGPHSYDGVLEGWVDGVKRVSRHPAQSNGLRWWGPDSASFKIDGLYYSSFYGGGDPSWAPSSTTYVRFDDFRVATTRAGVE